MLQKILRLFQIFFKQMFLCLCEILDTLPLPLTGNYSNYYDELALRHLSDKSLTTTDTENCFQTHCEVLSYLTGSSTLSSYFKKISDISADTIFSRYDIHISIFPTIHLEIEMFTLAK